MYTNYSVSIPSKINVSVLMLDRESVDLTSHSLLKDLQLIKK